jgi:glycosyltransferase involved in cell wall biosynthesis
MPPTVSRVSSLKRGCCPPVPDLLIFCDMTAYRKEVSDPALMQRTPVVSVSMVSYNHSAFIAEAIEGVAMQKAEFPIELVVGVDQSPDNTLEIVLRYQKLYPQLVRVLVAEQRMGAHKNALSTLGACRGEYIALCDGDDHWIHPGKLAKQVDALEKDSSLAGCFHDCYFLNQRTGRKELALENRKIDPRPDTASIIRENNIASCTTLFRNCISISELGRLTQDLLQMDRVLWLLVSEHGPLQYLAEPMAVHLTHDGGIWSSLSEVEVRRQQLRFIYALMATNRYPALRGLLLAVRRNKHRRLSMALAAEYSFLKSLYHYGLSIGSKRALRGTQVKASIYWRILARSASSRVGLEAPLASFWKKLAQPKTNR